MKKICFFIIAMFFSCFSVKAECDSNLELLLANNIAYSYEFDEQMKVFDVTFTNINNNFNFVDAYGNFYFGYDEIKVLNLSPGKTYKFKVYSQKSECNNMNVRTIEVSLPHFNIYYDRDICKKAPNFKYCNKWDNSNLDYEQLEEKVNKYLEEQVKDNKVSDTETFLQKMTRNMLKLYEKTYFIILPIIIIGLIFTIRKLDKKNDIL